MAAIPLGNKRPSLCTFKVSHLIAAQLCFPLPSNPRPCAGLSLDKLETLSLVGDEIRSILGDSAVAASAPSQVASPMNVTFTGKDVLGLQSASSPSGSSIQAALWLSEISARLNGTSLEAQFLKSQFYLREGKAVDVALPTTSMTSWFDENGFAFVASEDELYLSLTRTPAMPQEIKVCTRSLRVSLSKETAGLLRTLVTSRSTGQVDFGSAGLEGCEEEELYMEEFTSEMVQEAISLDIRGQVSSGKGEQLTPSLGLLQCITSFISRRVARWSEHEQSRGEPVRKRHWHQVSRPRACHYVCVPD